MFGLRALKGVKKVRVVRGFLQLFLPHLILLSPPAYSQPSPPRKILEAPPPKTTQDIFTHIIHPADGSATTIEKRRAQAGGKSELLESFSVRPEGVLVELPSKPLLAVATEARKAGVSAAALDDRIAQQEVVIDDEEKRLKGSLESALGRSLAGAGALSAGKSGSVKRLKAAFNGFVLSDISFEEAAAKLKGIPGVKVHRNTRVRIALDTSVPYIGASQVWSSFQQAGKPIDGTGITIGIIDTGVDYKHPDLGGCFGPRCRVAGGYDFVARDRDPMDEQGHGTHVAATAAGLGTYTTKKKKRKLLPGVAPGATIYAYRVLDAKGSGETDALIEALERCSDPNQDGSFNDHLDVCSLSIGGNGTPDDPVSKAVDLVVQNGTVCTVAAGNTGPNPQTLSSPGVARDAITVAAACEPGSKNKACANGPIATFSSQGPVPDFPDLLKPDIAAPGVDICAALSTGQVDSELRKLRCFDKLHFSISGTSMATPHIAGVVALMLHANPTLSPKRVKTIMQASARDLKLPAFSQGAGLVDAYAAVRAAAGKSGPLRFLDAPVDITIAPTSATEKLTRTITVFNPTKRSVTLTIPAETVDNGVSVAPSVTNVTLPPQGTTSIDFQVTIDSLRERATSQFAFFIPITIDAEAGEIPVLISLGQLLKTDLHDLNFGLSDGSLPQTSDLKTIQLTNSLKDAPLTVQVNTSCCTVDEEPGGSGVRLDAGTSTISIPPGSSIPLSLRLQVAGDSAPNGRYVGSVLLRSPSGSVSVPITFFKGYKIDVTTGRAPLSFFSLSHDSGERAFDPGAAPQPGPTTFDAYVRHPGKWFAMAEFSVPGSENAILGAKSVQVGSTGTPQVYLDADESTIPVVLDSQSIYPSGEDYKARGFTTLLEVRPRDTSSCVGLGFGSSLASLMINPQPPEHSLIGISLAAVRKRRNSSINVFTVRHTLGITAPLTITPPPPERFSIMSWSHETRNDSSSLFISACLPSNLFRGELSPNVCSALGLFLLTPARDGSFPVYASSYDTDTDPHSTFLDLPSLIGQAVEPKSEITQAASPHLSFQRGRIIAHHELGRGLSFRPRIENYYETHALSLVRPSVLSLGTAPIIDIGRWYNAGVTTNFFIPQQGIVTPDMSFGGSSYDVRESTRITFELLLDGQKVPSSFAYHRAFNRPFLPLPIELLGIPLPILPATDGSQIAVPGRYTFRQAISYKLAGQDILGLAESSFTIPTLGEHQRAPRDENPPFITAMHIKSLGLWQGAIDSHHPNEFEFSIDPAPGLGAVDTRPDAPHYHQLLPDDIASISLSQRIDGKKWETLDVREEKDNTYRAPIITSPKASMYHFKLSSKDLAGNTYDYLFSVPAGGARTLTEPLVKPIKVRARGIPKVAPANKDFTVDLTTKNALNLLKCEIVVNGLARELSQCKPRLHIVAPWTSFPPGALTIKFRVTDIDGREAETSEHSVRNPPRVR